MIGALSIIGSNTFHRLGLLQRLSSKCTVGIHISVEEFSEESGRRRTKNAAAQPSLRINAINVLTQTLMTYLSR